MTYLLYWQDAALRPGVLRNVPEGFEPVTDLHAALGLIDPHIRAAGLPPVRAAHFGVLWRECLREAMLPSGLLLVRLSPLADVLGHSTSATVRRWSAFCDRRGLWVHVPGKLVPPRAPGSGQRCRARLVVRPIPGR